MTDLQLDLCSLTDVGRARANNEDAVVVDAQRGVVVLADGMGGYNAGEVASALAVNLISEELARWLDESISFATLRDVRRAMEICVDNANRTIFEAAHVNASYAGMGTTLVMAVRHHDTLLIGHAGDSRAYRWRDKTLEQVTRDHSLLQEQIDVGLITPQEAATSSHRNLVTRALGVEDCILLDIQECPLADGDLYLLCSDGLSEMVSDQEMSAVLANDKASLTERAQQLVDHANANGGRDNISVALIHVHHAPKKAGVVSKLLGK